MGISITGGVKVPQGKFRVYVAPPTGPQLWAWGQGVSGQLGLENNTNYSSPVQVGALVDWASVSTGNGFSHAIKSDGTIWSFGSPAFGRLGNGTVSGNKSSPIQIGSLTNWSSVSSGFHASHAIKTDGTLWAWGRGDYGQLGLGDVANRSSPVQIGMLTTWASVSSERYSAHAIKTNGQLWAWGDGNFGRLGSGSTTDVSSPIQIGSLTTWSSISDAVNHSIAVKTDGTLWTWGFGGGGRLGHGNTTTVSSPVQVGGLTTWASASAGSKHSLAVKTDGTLWAWGYNQFSGKIGDGTKTDRSSPVQVGALTDWSSAIAGNYSSFAIKTNGELWAWGDSQNYGVLGRGNTTDYSSPVQVGTDTDWTSIDIFTRHVLAIKTTT